MPTVETSRVEFSRRKLSNPLTDYTSIMQDILGIEEEKEMKRRLKENLGIHVVNVILNTQTIMHKNLII